MNIPVIYEDNHILIAEKPVNIPSQKDESEDDDILTLLKNDIKKRYDKPGNVYLGLVHRLDRPAGGVMVFARTSKAAARLSSQMRSGGFKKTYMAVVIGKPESPKGSLKNFLIKDAKTNTVRTTDKTAGGAKPAMLDYEVVEHTEGLSLVRINLLTGRPHQIRVQFSAIGHPLWGDQKYGRDFNKPGQQLALWAVEIAFDHPVTKERISFSSPLPVAEPWSIFTR